ncbi:MAG: hypothetical protein M3P27_07960 [Acidobacteriota bacterium]|nr:hypothetical protein [Acidobacteriota bacterium]
MSDDFEQAILQRFQPTFLFSKDDCANAPTAFAPDTLAPTPLPHTEGTIYGQVSPGQASLAQGTGSVGGISGGVVSGGMIEVHYFHLWARDCGQRGHPLDAERVSVLLERERGDSTAANDWTALYWYSSAHEATVCDASRIHTASSLQAETAGPRVWVSKGKHASYLEQARCRQGCRADKCVDVPEALTYSSALVINLGEPGRAMNGASWANAASWQLSAKMQKSDFLAADLDALSAARSTALSSGEGTSIAVGARPMSGFQTAVAIASQPPQKTGMALDQASQHTDSAIQRSAKEVRRSLIRAFASTVEFVSGR